MWASPKSHALALPALTQRPCQGHLSWHFNARTSRCQSCMCCQGKEPRASRRAGLFKLNLVNSELNSVKTNTHAHTKQKTINLIIPPNKQTKTTCTLTKIANCMLTGSTRLDSDNSSETHLWFRWIIDAILPWEDKYFLWCVNRHAGNAARQLVSCADGSPQGWTHSLDTAPKGTRRTSQPRGGLE